jgi:hypothetical protein
MNKLDLKSHKNVLLEGQIPLGSFTVDFKKMNSSQIQELRRRALNFEPEYLKLLVDLFAYELREKKVSSWIDFFENMDLCEKVEREFYLRGFLMNQMHEILRNRKFTERELLLMASNPVLKKYVIESFVDYTSLYPDGYYSRIIKYYDPLDLEEESFKKSLILVENYLAGNEKEVAKWSQALSRYPSDPHYFPIINSRIWAARFLDQTITSGFVQEDMIDFWWDEWSQMPESQRVLGSLEVLPIVVAHGQNPESKKRILDRVEAYMKTALVENPATEFVEFGVFLASKILFYKQIKDSGKVLELTQELDQMPFLPSYRHYIQAISTMQIGNLS